MVERWRFELPLAALIRDSRVQPRESINATTVSEYAAAMAKIPVIREAGLEAASFPPIMAFRERKDSKDLYWLADGWHRVLAAEEMGADTIDAEVEDGDVYAAIMYAAGSNATHGLRRTNHDKRRSVRMLLDHPTVIREQWSDVRVAVQAGVGTTLVKTVRQERENELGLPPSRERRGSDGKLYSLQTRTSEDASQSPVAGRSDEETEGDGKLLIHQCSTPGCDAVTTEPSWHCPSCNQHWPLSIAEVAHCPECDDCTDEHTTRPATILATLTDVEITGGNTANGTLKIPQAKYTPGTLKASGATLAYERLVSALELILSLDGMEAQDIMNEAPDPDGLRREMSKAREFLLTLHAVSLGVRAL